MAADEDDGPPGAPKWMVTFSDCMTLLLTFFVLLLTFSSFDDKAFRKMTTSLSDQFASISVSDTRSRDALFKRDEIVFQRDRAEGSEIATENGQVDGNVKESPAFEFQDRKVFLMRSDDVFHLQATRLSEHGKQVLSDLATFLKAFPNKVVVSENQLNRPRSDGRQGYKRAWTAMDYLIGQGPLDPDRFAISGTSTVPHRNLPPRLQQSRSGRILEIVLLDKNICQ